MVSLANTFSFFVPGIPEAQGSMRAFRRGKGAILVHNKDRELRGWRSLILDFAGQHIPNDWPRDWGYELVLDFYFDRPKSAKKGLYKMIRKPDLDKLVRAIGDALTGLVWDDDSKIYKHTCEKHYLQAPDCSMERSAGVRVSIKAVYPYLSKVGGQ